MTRKKTTMLIGVRGTGEQEHPLLLRLSEHSERTAMISQNHILHTCYQWNVSR